MDKVKLLAALPEDMRDEASEFIDSQNQLKGIDDKDKVLDFVDKNQLFKSAFDSKVSGAIDTFKMNNALKVEREIEDAKALITKELTEQFNPSLTDEQKLIKSLSDKIDNMTGETIKDKQLLIAKDFVKGKIYDGVDVSPYLGKTDAETIDNLNNKLIEPYTNFRNSQIETFNEVLTKEVNNRLNMKDTPKGNNNKNNPAGEMSRQDFMSKSPVEQMSIAERGVVITD